MKKLVKKLFKAFGLQISLVDKRNTESEADQVDYSRIIPEISDAEKEMIQLALMYSMTSAERMWAVIQSLKHIIDKKIPGDIIECGVWKGGNILLFSLFLDKHNSKRNIWAYDTYDGMSDPTDVDISFRGADARTRLEQIAKNLTGEGEARDKWCYSGLEEVQSNLLAHVQDIEHIKFVKGKVEDTLKDEQNIPKQISLLRLDTDWYESTKAELEILYPRLASGGILIIDDYGHWQGSQKAVDEYFAGQNILLHRIDYSCRLLIKE